MKGLSPFLGLVYFIDMYVASCLPKLYPFHKVIFIYRIMNQTENQCDISSMASLVPLFGVKNKYPASCSAFLFSLPGITFSLPCVEFPFLAIVLNLILATNPIILSLLCDLRLWSLTGYFFICPADLLICICSCELYKLLTHPTLLQGCCRLCSTPWVTSSSWTVKEQCSVLIRLLHLLTKFTISVYKSILSLISPVLTFSFLMLQRICVIYYFLQSRRAGPFPLKWFWIKAIHTCLLVFISHLLLSFPCYLYSSQPSWVFWFVYFMVMHEKISRGTDLDYKQLHFILCEASLISSCVAQCCWWCSTEIWKNYQNVESLTAVRKSSIEQSVQ